MKPVVVVLGALVAVAAAYGVADVRSSDQRRVRARSRMPVPMAAVTPVEDVAPGGEPLAPAPAPTVAPSAPAPTKQAPPKVELHSVEDIKLPHAEHAIEPTFGPFTEIHVDAEDTLSWVGGGKTTVFNSYKELKGGFHWKYGRPVVIASNPDVTWQTIRWIASTAQEEGSAEVWLGVGTAKEPTLLRILSIRQTARPDEPLPEGEQFRVAVREKGDDLVCEVNGAPVESFPADLALRWNEWSKAHADLADSSEPERTRVVLEVHRNTPVGKVVRVLDVLRGLGIKSERYAGEILPRPR